MLSFICISQAEAQHIESRLMLDSRVGYSTNTVLNPFFGEWDRSESGGYGLLSPTGQLMFDFNSFMVETVAAGFTEPFFSDRPTLYGGIGILNMRYRLSDRFTAGIESGGSHISSTFDRSMIWAQPVLSWAPGLFTRVHVKAGSLYRSYSNFGEETQAVQNRFDLYAVELETWLSFRWKATAGLHGNLDRLSDNLSMNVGLERMITRNFRASLRSGVDQFRVDIVTQQNGSGPGPGFPPGGGPGGPPDGTQTVTDSDTDRIWRIGLSTAYQMSPNITITAGVDNLNYTSSMTNENIRDVHMNAGVRLSFRPTRSRDTEAVPEWRSNDNQSVIVNFRYQGDGELYIVGDFNNWEQPGTPLRKQREGRYIAQLSLEPGIYEYKILLIEGSEERWIDFSDDTHTSDDGFGGENGMIFID